MATEIALLKGRTLTEQINLGVRPDVKARYYKLKSHGIDVNEEARKMLDALIARLEQAVQQNEIAR